MDGLRDGKGWALYGFILGTFINICWLPLFIFLLLLFFHPFENTLLNLFFRLQLPPEITQIINLLLHLHIPPFNLKQLDHQLINHLHISPYNLFNFRLIHINNLLQLPKLKILVRNLFLQLLNVANVLIRGYDDVLLLFACGVVDCLGERIRCNVLFYKEGLQKL